MNFDIERPYACYGIIILIPAVLFTIFRYRKIVKSFITNPEVFSASATIVRLRRCFFFRTFFRCMAWIMLVLAYAGISWGVKTVPVQKSGSTVSFVFDISYSMTTRDGPSGISRLDAECNYARGLLEKLEGTSVSVVLAKGDGIVTIPLTEDYNAINSMLSQMHPNLISAEGTDLASGIRAAMSSFPVQSARAGCIWLFTDGEETRDSLLLALNEAVRCGIPVAIIGFGSERESELLLADGKSKVKTALRSKALEETIAQVKQTRSGGITGSRLTPVIYVDASEYGSAGRLLKMLNPADGSSVSYEVHLIPRKSVFINLSVLFFLFSLIAGEIDFRRAIKNFTRGTAIGLVLLCLTSCSKKFDEGRLLFEGKMEWNRKNYNQATAYFLEVSEMALQNGDKQACEYARFNLAVTYLMQDENDSAAIYFKQILDEATESTDSQVRYAALYNSGIIAHRQGKFDEAAEFFKKALLVDSSSTDAKINLELSVQEKSLQVKPDEKEIVPVVKADSDSNLENAVYSIIRENEEERWKNQQQKTKSSSLDY
ncbi:VWA domain-containing protein [Treponema sp.]|uniref:VWA domain-containing protein n=1 Tax=Treponema sp. TaxID=166 RepID=UPI002600E08C|nr:VWA domain-containing protein [Treponema sp.]MCR5219071.1 VWA domain-containing protein [Treponema sp.]